MRVQEAIDRLGYTPNVVARSLRQQQSRTIGLVVPDFESPFFGELIDVIESEAAKVGYGLIVGACRGSGGERRTRFRGTGIAAGRGFAVRGVEHGHQATRRSSACRSSRSTASCPISTGSAAIIAAAPSRRSTTCSTWATTSSAVSAAPKNSRRRAAASPLIARR